eukprot:6490367-Amphidinium_carterae.2
MSTWASNASPAKKQRTLDHVASIDAVIGEGPRDLQDVLTYPLQSLRALAEYDLRASTDMQGSVLKRLQSGVVLTSCYSGIGGAETAMAMLMKAAEGLGAQSKVCFYSACDIEEQCQRCLCGHHAISRPQHVFTDVLDRLNPPVRRSLTRIVEESIARYESDLKLLSTFAGDLGVNNADVHGEAEQEVLKSLERERTELKDRSGSELVTQLLHVLCSVDFERSCPCFACKHDCPVNPRHDERICGSEALWVEVAGTTCVAWSQLGGQLSLPCKMLIIAESDKGPRQRGKSGECI